MFRNVSMDKNEKAGVTVRVYESTMNKINQWKGKLPIGLFIDNAVGFYVEFLENEDAIHKISQDIKTIEENQRASLGLLCEVLKQAGILNGNDEIQFPIKVD